MKLLKIPALTLLFAGAGPARAAGATDTMQPANDVLEHFVDWLQAQIFPDGAHSELVHWIACGVLFVAAILLRRVVTNIIFRGLKKLAERTETTLEVASEPPAGHRSKPKARTAKSKTQGRKPKAR